jgi:hypothetical protein
MPCLVKLGGLIVCEQESQYEDHTLTCCVLYYPTLGKDSVTRMPS